MLLQISKSKSIYTRVRLFARKGDFVMGITVLIVTAVSTSYKREASPVDYSKFSFGLVCGILRFCILGESTGNWTIS